MNRKDSAIDTAKTAPKTGSGGTINDGRNKGNDSSLGKTSNATEKQSRERAEIGYGARSSQPMKVTPY